MRTYVYIIENLKNNHRYVGISYRPYLRWKEHIALAARGKSQHAIHRAMRKYDQMFFDFYVVSKHDTREEAYAEEIRLIAEYGAEYNLSSGGESGFVGVRHTDSAKEKLSRAGKGRVLTTEHKKKLSEAGKRISPENLKKMVDGSNRHWRGRKHTESTKLKMREAKLGKPGPSLGRPVSAETRQRIADTFNKNPNKSRILDMAHRAVERPLICLNDNKRFDAIKYAAEHYGISKGTIASVAHGKRESTKNGLKFRYLEKTKCPS